MFGTDSKCCDISNKEQLLHMVIAEEYVLHWILKKFTVFI